jgi:site-specific DNA-methyltransferase (adenine-specific)
MIENYINKIINKDCLEVIKSPPDNSIDLVLTDPPYGLNKNSSQGAGKLKNRIFNQGKISENWDSAPEKEYFDEIFRVSKNQIIWGGNYFNLPTCRCFLVWDKCQPWQNFSQVEYAWTSFDKPAKLFKFDNRIGGKIHPTQKPLQLFEWCVDNFSNKGDLILDCYSGSGTTAIACHNLKRNFICIEKNKEFYDLSVDRLRQAQKQETLF